MAQTNFTPILLYASGTPTNVPTAGNLTSSASGAELAVNYADGKLFYKDSGGNVQTLASKATGSIGGSDTQIQYNSSGSLAGSANLTFNGTTLTANALVGIGGSPSVGGVQLTVLGGGTQLSPGTTAQEGLRIQRATGFATLTGINNNNNAYNGLQFFTGASAAATIDTSGNVAVGTTNAGTAGLSLSQNYNLSWEQSATESVPNLFRQTSSAALVMSVGYKRSATANGFASSFGSSLAKTAISLGTTAGAITFYTDTAATTAVGTDVTPTERMRIDSSGNVGIGTAPSYTFDVYRSGTNTSVIVARNDNSVAQFYSTSSSSFAGTSTNTPFGFITNNTERMRFLAGGGITSEDRADAVGYKGTPLNEQSANYTLVIGDMGKSITHPASDNNPRTFTIPANGSVAYPVGTAITFVNMINTVTIAITTDTMYLAGAGTTGSRTLAAYGMATAVKMTSTTWIISGNGLT